MKIGFPILMLGIGALALGIGTGWTVCGILGVLGIIVGASLLLSKKDVNSN